MATRPPSACFPEAEAGRAAARRRHRRGAERSGQYGPGLAAAAVHDLIGLKPGVGNMATVEDVASNPKRRSSCPSRARNRPQLRRRDGLGHVHHLRQAGRTERTGQPGFRQQQPGRHPPLRDPRVTTPERANDPRLLKFIAIYQGLARGQGHAAAAVWRPDRLSWRRAAGSRVQACSRHKKAACAGSGAAGVAQCENMIGTVMVFRIGGRAAHGPLPELVGHRRP